MMLVVVLTSGNRVFRKSKKIVTGLGLCASPHAWRMRMHAKSAPVSWYKYSIAVRNGARNCSASHWDANCTGRRADRILFSHTLWSIAELQI